MPGVLLSAQSESVAKPLLAVETICKPGEAAAMLKPELILRTPTAADAPVTSSVLPLLGASNIQFPLELTEARAVLLLEKPTVLALGRYMPFDGAAEDVGMNDAPTTGLLKVVRSTPRRRYALAERRRRVGSHEGGCRTVDSRETDARCWARTRGSGRYAPTLIPAPRTLKRWRSCRCRDRVTGKFAVTSGTQIHGAPRAVTVKHCACSG